MTVPTISKEEEEVPTEKGRMLHEAGRVLPVPGKDRTSNRSFVDELAAVLRTELGGTRVATKTVMRWTGAGERTVKTWFGGVSGPNGEHLIRLIRHSDAVFTLVINRSGRTQVDAWAANARAQRHMLSALAVLQGATGRADEADRE
jgi:hypothetical protein